MRPPHRQLLSRVVFVHPDGETLKTGRALWGERPRSARTPLLVVTGENTAVESRLWAGRQSRLSPNRKKIKYIRDQHERRVRRTLPPYQDPVSSHFWRLLHTTPTGPQHAVELILQWLKHSKNPDDAVAILDRWRQTLGNGSLSDQRRERLRAELKYGQHRNADDLWLCVFDALNR